MITKKLSLGEQWYDEDRGIHNPSDPVRRFVFNAGVIGAKYDKDTGIHSVFGNGILEFRIGDEVENIHNKKREVIVSIIPDAKGRPGMTTLEFARGRRCLLHVVRPTNPERITFGFVVRTVSDINGQPTGSASRYITREQAETEVQRLVDVGYPGAVQVLDSE